jgi:hypothetical protein
MVEASEVAVAHVVGDYQDDVRAVGHLENLAMSFTDFRLSSFTVILEVDQVHIFSWSMFGDFQKIDHT